ncbi:winged helix-turn-helix transcriptional regulator [Actinomadura soli]|uniref:Winged helix-turn-helix transcriptional regulator n=1 Tax=Actinomadura soli TaxID=2508997 RepID=A0A5C4JFR8_9ACTN|nr:winged helix-turn-helix domain-containing protein [Actinomadura soli]TMR04162.1 winged helix-turn-helix transcriptional regulator [Actinomadura soli]
MPSSSYWPDFLTPDVGTDGLDAALDALVSTPRARVARELDKLTSRSGAPSWGTELATGNSEARTLLRDHMGSYFSAALAPRWPDISRQVAIEHTRLMSVLRTGGPEALLASLRPFATWRPSDRVLEARYPVPLDVHLEGRGLRLIPSWFCCAAPVVLADAELPPVLVYPLTHQPPPVADPDALAKLLGPTRARVLATITVATSTATIQHRTGISASQLSRHTAVLAASDLILQARHAGRTFYSRTPLGNSLIASTGQEVSSSKAHGFDDQRPQRREPGSVQ